MPTSKIRKTGLPPGSLIYTGALKTDVILKELVRYNAESIEQIDPDSTPETDPNFFYWLDVRGLHNPQEIEVWAKHMGWIHCFWKMYWIRINDQSVNKPKMACLLL